MWDPVFLLDNMPSDICPISGKVILDSIGERDYVMSFFAVKNGCTLTLERKEDGLREGTADIIRLIEPEDVLQIRVHSLL
jgi:hypothetical protein